MSRVSTKHMNATQMMIERATGKVKREATGISKSEEKEEPPF